MSRTTAIRQLRDAIVSLRDAIRQLRRTIEHERVLMTPHPYPSHGSEKARRHAAQLDFPGFCSAWLAAAQGRTGAWATDEMLAGVYGRTAIEIPQHVHRGSAARVAAMGAVAALEDPPN